MRFIVDPVIFEKYPDLVVGVLAVHGVNNTKRGTDIAELLRKAEATVRATMSEETYREHPKIAALQQAHRAFGSNPNKFPPSIQALIKRIQKGRTTAVDQYDRGSL